jgi:predicted small lipoprotein YifL
VVFQPVINVLSTTGKFMLLNVRRYLYFGVAFSFWLLLAGCGQKGRLYLPEIPDAPNVITDTRALDEGGLQTEQEEVPDKQKASDTDN